ncbi:tetratricopeptide repeat protein [Pelagerythrobacter rhizovicinus]|nr:tetratricopeptide repeat protein [Pelagerythrobacter rhizovicinus]
MLGVLEMRAGNLAAAGAALDRALRADQDDPELWVDIGRLRYLGGEHTMAIEAADRAIALGPRNPEALQFRGQLVRDAYGMPAALPWFESALEVAPDNPEVLADYAASLGESGRAGDMLAAARRMAEVAPDDPRPYFLQAAIAARAGDFELAQSLLSRRSDLDRTSPAAALLSGVIDLQRGNPASAAQRFDRLLASQPDNRRVRQLLVHALHLSGNDRELVYRFGKAAMLPDADPYFVEIVGRAYESLGQRDEAAPLLEKAARFRDPHTAPMATSVPVEIAGARDAASGVDAVALVRGLIASQRLQEAIVAGEAFRTRFPGSSDALGLAGDAFLAAGRPGEALRRYRAAAGIRRPWPLTRRMFAAHAAREDTRAAYALLAGHLRGEPRNREAATMLALLALEFGRQEEGAAMLDRALASGGERDPRLWALKAEVALLQDDIAGARDAAEHAYRLSRSNRQARHALAGALTASGEVAAARALTSP